MPSKIYSPFLRTKELSRLFDVVLLLVFSSALSLALVSDVLAADGQAELHENEYVFEGEAVIVRGKRIHVGFADPTADRWRQSVSPEQIRIFNELAAAGPNAEIVFRGVNGSSFIVDPDWGIEYSPTLLTGADLSWELDVELMQWIQSYAQEEQDAGGTAPTPLPPNPVEPISTWTPPSNQPPPPIVTPTRTPPLVSINTPTLVPTLTATPHLTPNKNGVHDPIYTNNGALHIDIADFSHERPGYAMRFMRHFNPQQTSPLGHLGPGWMSSFDHCIRLNENGTQAMLFQPQQVLTFTRTIEENTFVSPPSAFGVLEKLDVSPLPADLAMHPNLGTGSPEFEAFSLQALFRVTDRTGRFTYYGVLSAGPANLARALVQLDNNNNKLYYIHETFNRGQIIEEGVNTIDLRLRKVTADPTPWSIDFFYHTDTEPRVTGSETPDRYLRAVVSSAGDYIQFTVPGNETRVTRGTLSNHFGGHHAFYHYELDPDGFPQIVKKDDPLGDKADKHISYDYQRNGLGDIVGGINKIYNGRNQLMLELEYPNPIPTGVNSAYSTLVKKGGRPQRRDYYDGADSRPMLSADLYVDSAVHQQIFEYNDAGQATKAVDGKGNAVDITYDDLGNVLTRKTGASDNLEEYTYFDYSRVHTYKDRRGKITTFSYYPNGNLQTVSAPLNNTTTFTYHSNGLVHTVTESIDATTSRTTTYTYDSNGYPQSVQEPAYRDLQNNWVSGAVTTFNYDVRGRLMSRTDPDAGAGPKTTHFVWNDKDQRTDIYFPDGGHSHFEFDLNGNLRLEMDPNNKITRYAYDADDNMTDVWEASGTGDQVHARFEYDESGNRTAVIEDADGAALRTEFVYNQQNLLISQEGEDDHPVTFTYDEAMNLETRRDARNLGTFAYDADKRLLSATYSDGTFVNYLYDDNGNRTQMLDPEGLKTYPVYDDLNRLRQMVNHALGMTVDYSYDRVGNRLSMDNSKQPSGQPTTYQYYENGLLKSLTDPDGGVTTFKYDSRKRPTEKTLPGGIAKAQYSYWPESGRLKLVSNLNAAGETLTRHEYVYDLGGKIFGVKELHGESTFTYNRRDELTGAIYPGPEGTFSYGYDRRGNRTGFNGVAADYDRANQILSMGSTGFAHDATGNVRLKGQRTFLWDALDQLKEVGTAGGGGVIASYTYNGDRQRVARLTGGGVATKYVLDGLHVALELDGSNAVQRSYVPQISRTEQDGSKFYYLYNGHGDVAAELASAGTLIESSQYGPLGERRADGVGDVQGYLASGGVYNDKFALLQYMFHRWYDAELGRFISRDPIGIDGGLNLYGYAMNNPLGMSDTTGLKPASLITHDAMPFVAPVADYLVASSRYVFEKSWIAKNQYIAGGAMSGAQLAVEGVYAYNHLPSDQQAAHMLRETAKIEAGILGGWAGAKLGVAAMASVPPQYYTVPGGAVVGGALGSLGLSSWMGGMLRPEPTPIGTFTPGPTPTAVPSPDTKNIFRSF